MTRASKTTRVLRRALWWLRQVTGDAAYENYLRSVERCAQRRMPAIIADSSRVNNDPAQPLSPAEFYLDSLRRRYSTLSRCC